MTRKWFGNGIWAGGLLALAWMAIWLGLAWEGMAEGATRGIPGVTTAATMVGDTLRAIAVIIAPVLIIAAIYEARQHAGLGIVFSIFGVLLSVGILIYADEIVAFIKPGSAAAFTSLLIPQSMGWGAWWQLGQQLLSVGALAEGIRRARHTRGV